MNNDVLSFFKKKKKQHQSVYALLCIQDLEISIKKKLSLK